MPGLLFFQQIGVIQDMAHLMTQKAHAPRFRAAFHFHHHLLFEPLQPRMREIERDGDGRASFRAKPFVAEITKGLEGDPFRDEFAIEVLDS